VHARGVGGTRGMHTREGCMQRGGGGKECEQASGAMHKWKGVCTLSTPPAPSRLA